MGKIRKDRSWITEVNIEGLRVNINKASPCYPHPIFLNCMQNDVASVWLCLTTFHKKIVYYSTLYKQPYLTAAILIFYLKRKKWNLLNLCQITDVGVSILTTWWFRFDLWLQFSLVSKVFCSIACRSIPISYTADMYVTTLPIL